MTSARCNCLRHATCYHDYGTSKKIEGNVALGLNIFYSGIKYTEKDWVRHKMQHYPLQKVKAEVQKHKNTNMWHF